MKSKLVGGLGLENRLLVLDDDPAVGATVVRLAKRLGFTCSAIQSGSGLSKILSETRASVLILDLSMPDMSGVDVIEQLATLEAPPSLILLSGMDKRVVEAASRSASLMGLRTLGCLTKPFGSAEFEQVLEPLLNSQGSHHYSSVESKLAASFDLDPIEILRNAEIWFQPQVEAEGSSPTGFEALGRFRLDNGEPIDTEHVIALLKKRDYLNRYTKTLIDGALRFGTTSAFEAGCTVAVNVCASQFTSSWLPNYLRRRCDELGADPKLVVLEVTETEQFSDESAVLRNLTGLRIDGFRLAVDDFGIGHSTFKRITDFPFTDLKIDRSFVSKMLIGDDAYAIVTSLIELARKFGLTVTAEGVGNRETAQKLASLGCDIFQGYLISVPLPFEEAAAWLNARKNGADPSDEPLREGRSCGAVDPKEHPPLTVCLVDDDTAIRQNMMAGLRNYQIDCRPFASGADFLDGLQDVDADAYLIDLRMPEMDGLQTLAQIPTEFRDVPAIMFSGHGDVSKAVEAMKSGAQDFIEKPATIDKIASKIRSVVREAPKAKVPANQSREAQELLTKLTQREREIVLKVSEGKKNREIADELGIGKRTIEVHRTNIYSKLGVRNAVELTNMLQMAGVRPF